MDRDDRTPDTETELTHIEAVLDHRESLDDPCKKAAIDLSEAHRKVKMAKDTADPDLTSIQQHMLTQLMADLTDLEQELRD